MFSYNSVKLSLSKPSTDSPEVLSSKTTILFWEVHKKNLSRRISLVTWGTFECLRPTLPLRSWSLYFKWDLNYPSPSPPLPSQLSSLMKFSPNCILFFNLPEWLICWGSLYKNKRPSFTWHTTIHAVFWISASCALTALIVELWGKFSILYRLALQHP